MTDQNDPYADVLTAVLLAMAEDLDKARRELVSIRFAPPAVVARSDPSIGTQVHVYQRDHWQCRYCARRTIPTVVMRLISRAFPVEFPYQANWRPAETHPAYNARATTLDHVVPVAWGGPQKDPANLVTSCWPCNRRKGDLRLEELGWELRDPASSEWDGLLGLYQRAYTAAGHPPLTEDERTFLRAAGVAVES